MSREKKDIQVEKGAQDARYRRSGVLREALAARPDRTARLKQERKEIRELLNKKKRGALKSRLKTMHPADVAEYFEDMPHERIRIVMDLVDDERAAEILQWIEDEELQLEVAKALGRDRLAEILDAMPSDEVVDLLSRFDEEEIDRLLEGMDDEDVGDLKELLTFDEESAGGLMEVELVEFYPSMTTGEVIERIREKRDEMETISYLYVTDAAGVLVGVLSLRMLMLAGSETPIGEYMLTDVIRVHVTDDQEEVANVVAKYDLLAVPVVDDHGVLKGIVTIDDILDVLEEEATEDIFGMAGLSAEEVVEESPFRSAARRLPWLLLTLVGAFLSGFILERFSSTLDKAVALAIFIPGIMALGGNIAVQASTLVVRGFATGDVSEQKVGSLIFKEVLVGLFLGVILGGAAGGIGSLWIDNPMIGAVVATSMTAQFTVAATLGTLIPYGLRRLDFDPALASGPFVTMVSDITGLVIYFSLASFFLDRLIS